MSLKSINLIIEDNFPLICKYIIVSYLQQVKTYLPKKKSSYANSENNNFCLENETTHQSNFEYQGNFRNTLRTGIRKQLGPVNIIK